MIPDIVIGNIPFDIADESLVPHPAFMKPGIADTRLLMNSSRESHVIGKSPEEIFPGKPAIPD
jgi:hypothetical protein